MTIVEYSSICVRRDDWRQKLDEAHRFVTAAGFEFGVQIHNNSTLETTRKIVEWRPSDVKLSVHSPVLAKHFLNLATPHRDAIEETLALTLPVLDWAQTNLFFFHGFFLTEQPIEHDMARYFEVVGRVMNPEFSLKGSFIMNPAVFSTETYARHKAWLRANIEWIQKEHPHLVIALENDYPGLGTALQRPQDIIGTVPNLWLDLGHLWVSSIVNQFDFHAAIDELIEKVNIVGVHVHHNFSTPAMAPGELRDSHAHLYLPTTQNLNGVVQKLRDKKVPIFTLEVGDGDLEDLKILIGWLNS